jgi:hypothetical protein
MEPARFSRRRGARFRSSNGLRRFRLCGRKGCKRIMHLRRDRQSQAGPNWLRRSAEALGRRRFFAWINRNRRLAKDFEATIASARAFLYAASVMILVRRLARST